MPAIEIRPASADDLPALLAIYNDVIATSTAVYSLSPSTLSERQAWFDARRNAGYPVLAAASGGETVGFASFGEFRGAWPGYRYSVEHSVHVHRGHRGRGIGSALVEALIPLARAMDKHVMIGGIDATNAVSIALHEQLGFVHAGTIRQAGFKFGRWLDLAFYQLTLQTPAHPVDG